LNFYCEAEKTSGVILAGGEGRRVGSQQKGLLCYQGKPMIEWVMPVISKQVNKVWINANKELETYQEYSSNIYQDIATEPLGPLSGMHSAWHFIDSDWIVFVPCDNPKLPGVLVERLIKTQQISRKPLIVVNDGERLQPLYCLMHRSMQNSLAIAIEKRHLSVWRWIKENPHEIANDAEFSSKQFQNLNTLKDYCGTANRPKSHIIIF